jgi:hypothetical protein
VLILPQIILRRQSHLISLLSTKTICPLHLCLVSFLFTGRD